MSQDTSEKKEDLMELSDPLMRFKGIMEDIAQRMKLTISFIGEDEILEACMILQFEFIGLHLCRFLSTMILEGKTDPEMLLDIFYKGGNTLLRQARIKLCPSLLLERLQQIILTPLEKRTQILMMPPRRISEMLDQAKMWLEALMITAINKRIPKKMNRMLHSLEILLTKTKRHDSSNEGLLRDMNLLTFSPKKKSMTTTLLDPRWEISRHVFRAFFRIDACYSGLEDKKKAWKTLHADMIFKIIILAFFHVEQILHIFFWLSEEDHERKKSIMHRLFRRKIQRDFLLQKINILFYLDEFIPSNVLPMLTDDYFQQSQLRKKKERHGSEMIYQQNKIYLEKELSVLDHGRTFLSFLYRQQKKHLFLVDVQNICRVSFHMKDNKKINNFIKRPAIYHHLLSILFKEEAARVLYSSYASNSFWIMVNKGDVRVNRATKEISIVSHENGVDSNIFHVWIACFDPVTEMDSFFNMGGDEMDDIFIVKVISDLYADSQRKRGNTFPFTGIHVLSHDLYSNISGYKTLLQWKILDHPYPLGKKDRFPHTTSSRIEKPLSTRVLLQGQERSPCVPDSAS